MGIRETQLIGLNSWACNFVEGDPQLIYTEQIVRVYPDGRRESVADRPVYETNIKREESVDHCIGMFDEEIPLYKYTFPSGMVYYERVYAEPWSSGPVIFLALKDENYEWVPQSLWSDEKIEEYT